MPNPNHDSSQLESLKDAHLKLIAMSIAGIAQSTLVRPDGSQPNYQNLQEVTRTADGYNHEATLVFPPESSTGISKVTVSSDSNPLHPGASIRYELTRSILYPFKRAEPDEGLTIMFVNGIGANFAVSPGTGEILMAPTVLGIFDVEKKPDQVRGVDLDAEREKFESRMALLPECTNAMDASRQVRERADANPLAGVHDVWDRVLAELGLPTVAEQLTGMQQR